MKFPTVGEIATRSVVSVERNATLADAMERMLQNDHRNIIVAGEDGYSVLNVLDIVNLQDQKFDLNRKLSTIELPSIPTIKKESNILDALELIKRFDFICVVEDDGSIFGLVTHSDVTENIDPETLMENYRLEDILKIGRNTLTTYQDAKTSEILKQMAERDTDSVVVLEDMKPVGILTTKDIIRLLRSGSDLSDPIKKYMISPVDTIVSTTTIKEALGFIKKKHYKRAVVVNTDRTYIGIIKQSELISLTYSNWASMMQKYQEELFEINEILKRKKEKYEHLATTDNLTGLYNRFKFSELFVSSYVTMVQRNTHMTLMMLDIDRFKQINDTFGHLIGDKVLVQVAHAMLRVLRSIDIVARWGGEEFIMLLPTATLRQGVSLAEKIRREVETLQLDTVDNVTVSIGVTEVVQGDSLDDAVKRADDALYRAKRDGRNRVETIDFIRKSYPS